MLFCQLVKSNILQVGKLNPCPMKLFRYDLDSQDLPKITNGPLKTFYSFPGCTTPVVGGGKGEEKQEEFSPDPLRPEFFTGFFTV